MESAGKKKIKKLGLIKDFDLKVALKGNKEEIIRAEVATTEFILALPRKEQEKMRRELRSLIGMVFNIMPKKEVEEYVQDYFTLPGEDFHRQTIQFRNEAGRLIATGSFDQGSIESQSSNITAVYGIMRAVHPEYQGLRFGQRINLRVLKELGPDLVFANTYQSGSLHSWLGLFQKGLIKGYEAFPRLEQSEKGEVIKTLPYEDIHFVIDAFRQIYIRFVRDESLVEKELNNLTVHMVRKNNHTNLYDYDPWAKGGRVDKVAKALGATSKDGVLVVIRKKNS